MAGKIDLTPYLITVPDRVKGQVFRWHGPGDGFVLFLSALSIIVVDTLYGQIAAVAAGAFGLSWLITLDNGRVYQVFAVWWKSRALKARRGVIWRAKPGKGNRSSPLRHLEIHILGDEIEGMPLIHNRKNREDAIVVIGDGAKMVAEGPAGQASFTRRLGGVITSAAAGAPGVRTSVGNIYMRRPTNMIAVAAAYGQSLHPLVYQVPTGGDEKERSRYEFLHEIAENQFNLVREYANSILMATVITIRTEGALNKLRAQDDRNKAQQARKQRRRKKAKATQNGHDSVEDSDTASLSELELKRLAITQIAENVVAEYEAAGISNPRVMTVGELRAFLRGGWDIASIGQFQEEMLLEPEAVLDPGDTRHWPARQIRATHYRLEIDDSYHAVIRLRGYPLTEALPVDFRELHTANARYITITLLGMTTRTAPEYQALDRAIPFWEDLKVLWGSSREGPKARRRRERLEDRQEQISRSVFKVDASWLIVVSTANPDDLEFEVQQVMKKCKSMGLNPKRVTGPIWIWRYFISAVTGLNLL